MKFSELLRIPPTFCSSRMLPKAASLFLVHKRVDTESEFHGITLAGDAAAGVKLSVVAIA